MEAAPRTSTRRTTIVAVGASAGGLESVGRLLEGLPARFPAPVLVVLHLDPHHPSLAVPLLQRRTALRVVAAKAGARLRAGTVYVAPRDRHLQVHAGRVRLTRGARVNHSRPSVDVLLRSVAAAYGSAAIGVILSGAGRDGALGLAAVKARGGLTVAEDTSTALFAAMPEAAARAGMLDAVLPVGQIPPFLLRATGNRVPVSELHWLRMLALLQARTGARFSRYRSSTLQRRLQHRLAATGSKSMPEYLRRLARDDGEAEALKAAFLIKVSSFLRDQASWRVLDRELARLAPGPGHGHGRGLRAWSAGCATGEEAYTLAMLLARRLGTGAPWKVYGTDLDSEALQAARAGRYGDAQVAAIPRAERARHFVRDGAAWRVRKALRDHVVFGRHDLLHDPPLPAMDVIACRNVLIYFQAAERERALHRLAPVLNPGGILFLGRSEGARSVPGLERIGRTTLFRKAGLAAAMADRSKTKATKGHPGARALGASLTDSSTIVAVGVDGKGRVRLWNRAAEAFFGQRADEAVGRPLAKAVGAEAARQLRSAMGAGAASPVALERDTDDGPRRRLFEGLPGVAPLSALFLGSEAQPPPARRGGTHVTAADVRPRHRTASARMSAQQELNEELQSRNEELETVNEELQSLNDELSTMEEQMRGMADESRLNNEFLRLLLDTSSDALIACDASNRVAFWSKAAVKRFRLSPMQAVGGDLFELVPALAHAPLRAAARKVRQPGRGGRVTVEQDGVAYVFDPLAAGAGKRRGYLLRVRANGS